MSKQLTAQVVVDRTSHQTDRLFDYLVPSKLAPVLTRGMGVKVPFGKGDRKLDAYVLQLEEKELEDRAYKEILSLAPELPVLDAHQIQLIFWMRKQYLCKYMEAVRCLVPKSVAQNQSKRETYGELCIPEDRYMAVRAGLRGQKQQQVFDYLAQQGRTSLLALQAELKTTRSVINGLVAKGLVSLTEETVRRDPFLEEVPHPFPKLRPTPEQQQVLDQIKGAIEAKQSETFLLHGVTGSGKTEIYLQLIEKVIEQGQQGIVLVPEIALTPQTVARFRGRFGEGVALLHSQLSEGERYDEWHRIQSGQVQIVIGARSAIFAPLNRLGIIIVDEEHEHTYKSEQSPRYHAVEIASFRSRQEQAVLVMGSATPSLESFYLSEVGVYQRLTLNRRATAASLPAIEMVDMRQELESGNDSVLSRRLIQQMGEKLAKKEQIILFLNRRGYATLINCPTCGHVFRCPHCDISMTYHRHTHEIKCHYCGHREPVPSRCSHCGAEAVKYTGAGTQKLEQLIQDLFPQARLARFDLDAVSRKGAHQQILGAFQRGELDILIGTQMISKGLDFPQVTLVGIISVDGVLSLPDFRSPERTFQLVTQVAGRAGRGLSEGVVVLQTYQPEHYSIQAALNHDYPGFYREEMMLRKEFGYPPFQRLICVQFSCKREKEVAAYVQKMAELIRYVLRGKGIAEPDRVLLGPIENVVFKVKEVYRYQLLLKDQGVDLNLLKGIIRYFFIQHRQKYVPATVTVSIDFNPYQLL